MVPPWFNSQTVGDVWRVPYGDRAQDAQKWQQQHQITAACEDKQRIGLLLIDVQNTFCIPDFELFVAGRSGKGAVEDNQRLCQFIYRHLGQITEIIPTLDTHSALQIFHPAFWVNDVGEHPAPMSTLDLAEIEAGTWRINPEIVPLLPVEIDAEAYARHYARQLTQESKYPLTIWAYHGMTGGIGHSLVAAVEEACFVHSLVRRSPTRYELKGYHPLTENYSVLKPEVRTTPDGHVIGQKNTALIEHLLSFDKLIIAGQAKSHCVAWTVRDLCQEIGDRHPDQAQTIAQRVYLLDDCTSAVVIPGAVDFTEPAEAAFAEFAAMGMQRVSSQSSSDWLP
ncbi:isochorismatase [Geitlerinema sp. P-1104]|uniref:isochorismatase n=1 Tax=Geitlerinema sp. P-1104 TaxID=2546230 RepID=UPI001476D645|nr:isochorismatase [Geitlerinema sp. P-1104]NMG57841.1 isochorismatase [Geitlerinema sp. P-1104]